MVWEALKLRMPYRNKYVHLQAIKQLIRSLRMSEMETGLMHTQKNIILMSALINVN